LYTPGHSADHLCFLIPEDGAVFTGDLILGQGSSMVTYPEGDVANYLRSLDRLAALRPRILFPGHWDSVSDAMGKIEEYRRHRLEREAQVLAEIRRGHGTAPELTRRVYGELDDKLLVAAEMTLRAHLRKLVDDGAVRERREVYEAAPYSRPVIDPRPPIASLSQADVGLTTKTLFELDGGHSVEAVVMRYSDRSTLCISSQAGCPIGCPFCATGKFPFGRNLKAHEIVEQAVDAQRVLAAEGRRLSHVVFMGMGEPMANYRAVVDSVRRLADPELLGISPRRIVVSTSGLIPRIEQLAEEKIPVTLAISPHARRDELRDGLG